MSEHTPGPWKRGSCDGFIIWAGENEEGGAVGYAYTAADANLIAAAPDMLKALYHAQEALFWHKAEGFEVEKTGEPVGQVVAAAIAKAVGP